MPMLPPENTVAGKPSISPASEFRPVSPSLQGNLFGPDYFFDLFQDSSDGAVLCSEERVVVEANPSFCRLFGYSLEEAVGAHIDSLIVQASPDIRDEADEVKQVLREQGHFEIETFRLRKDGTPVPVEVRGVSFFSAGSIFDVAIYRDISGHRETEEKLSRLQGLENLLLSVSRDLVSSDHLDRDMQEALKRICVFFGADRSYFFLLEEETGEMRLAHEWCPEGIPKLSSRLKRVTPRQRPWWFSRLEEGIPILVGDLEQMPHKAGSERIEFSEQGVESFLALPVYMGNSLGGALGLDNLRSRCFWCEDHVKDLSLFSDLLGRVLYQERVHKTLIGDLAERKRLEERARFDEERLSLALDASSNGLWDLDLETGLIEVSESTLHCLGYEPGEVIPSLDTWKKAVHPGDRDRVERVFLDHLAGSRGFYDERYRLKSRSGAYLWFQVRGKVVMRDERGRPLRVAGLIADETERHHIEEILEESLNRVNHLLEGTIDVISRLVESRDPYTAGHQKRVSQLAGAVARRMGLPRESVKGIQVAGLLHDIGKVCVPSDILSKPGKLTSLEFDLIRDHPSRGALILGKVDFPWPVRDIVEQHHERLDGLGYPRGLAGDEIRQESRIMAVADVVEAMISHRPYRPALGLEAALEEIRQGRGTLYDPAAVEACEAVFVEGFCFEA